MGPRHPLHPGCFLFGSPHPATEPLAGAGSYPRSPLSSFNASNRCTYCHNENLPAFGTAVPREPSSPPSLGCRTVSIAHGQLSATCTPAQSKFSVCGHRSHALSRLFVTTLARFALACSRNVAQRLGCAPSEPLPTLVRTHAVALWRAHPPLPPHPRGWLT